MPEPVDIEALRALADAATPGPWELVPVDEDGRPTEPGDALNLWVRAGEWWVAAPTNYHCCTFALDVAEDVFRHRPDLDLIVVAREAIPALCDEVERLRDAVVKYGWHYGRCPARWGGEWAGDGVADDPYLECECGFRDFSGGPTKEAP